MCKSFMYSNMYIIKLETSSSKVGLTWATWAKSGMGSIWCSFVTQMGLHMWISHETLLQIPSQSHVGCPYRTHIKFHTGPLWLPYILLAGLSCFLLHLPCLFLLYLCLLRVAFFLSLYFLCNLLFRYIIFFIFSCSNIISVNRFSALTLFYSSSPM